MALYLANQGTAPSKNWGSFYARTMHLPAAEFTADFLKYLPLNGRLLDFGAGSGAWSAAFLRDRLDILIDALDKNIDDARALPSDFNGQRFKQSFQDFHAAKPYDAIWARSVLFFLQPDELTPCFHQLASALTKGGIIAFTMVENCSNAALAKFYGMSETAIREMLDKEELALIRIS